MNVLIITEDDVFYLYEFFRYFFTFSKSARYNICGISILAPFNKGSKVALAKQMYGFYGIWNFFKMGFVYLVKKTTGQTILNLSKQNDIPYYHTKNVNNQSYIKKIKKNGIDIIVSIAAPQIFKKELIRSVRFGCINSHSSMLPENKGMMPVFWGLFKGANTIGVTVHYINENIDAGDIIKQEKVSVGNESLHEMILKTKKISAKLIHETLEQIQDGTVKSYPMPQGGSYQTFPTPEEVKEFRNRGKRIF